MPFWWLAGNTHKLAKHNWGPRSMGCELAIIHRVCEELLDDIKLVHNKSYMMNIFSDLTAELPEFEAHLTYQFEQKQTHFVEQFQTKDVPLKMLVDELFFSTGH